MALQLTNSYLTDSIALFRHYKGLAERAMAQVGDEQLFTLLDKESNSIAITVKHMAGNMRSRWTDFLMSDGEKPDRQRDLEFIDPPRTRAALMSMWEEGWGILFATLESLTNDQWILDRTGIRERHVLAKGLGVSDMCVENSEAVPLLRYATQKKERPTGRSASFRSHSAGGEVRPPPAVRMLSYVAV